MELKLTEFFSRTGTRNFPAHYQDDAVWYGAQWVDIEYPEGHPYYPDSIDMAFVLTSEQPDDMYIE